MIFLFKAVYIT